MAAAASASPLAAAVCASDRLIVPFAAKAKLGGKATSKIHSTNLPSSQLFAAKRMSALRPNGMNAVRFQTMHNNTATNPDHGGSADGAEKCQEAGHTENKGTSEFAADPVSG